VRPPTPEHRSACATHPQEQCEVLRAPALSAEARDQQIRARHQRTQRRRLLGVGEAGDGADVGVASLADAVPAELVDHPRDALVQQLSVRPRHVLQLAGAGIARAHEHEQALPEATRDVDHRLQRLGAEVRADGHRVRVVDWQLEAVADPHLPERRRRVGGHRVADVAALRVLDHEQACGSRVRLHTLERRDAGGAQRLEEGRLRLDGWHEVGDAIDHGVRERLDGSRRAGKVSRAVEQLRRQLTQVRVESDDEVTVRRVDALDQPVGEVGGGGHARAPV